MKKNARFVFSDLYLLQRLLNLRENLVRTIPASFGRSRSGKYREIRSTYSDFLFAVYFNEHNFYTLRFLRFAVNRPLMVYQNFKFRCVYKGLNATTYCCTFCKARIHTLLSLELMSTPISTVLRNWVEIYTCQLSVTAVSLRYIGIAKKMYVRVSQSKQCAS